MYESLDKAMEAFEPEKNERVALLNTTKGILVLSKSNGIPNHQWTMNFYFHCFGTEGIVDPHWTVSGDVQGDLSLMCWSGSTGDSVTRAALRRRRTSQQLSPRARRIARLSRWTNFSSPNRPSRCHTSTKSTR